MHKAYTRGKSNNVAIRQNLDKIGSEKILQLSKFNINKSKKKHGF